MSVYVVVILPLTIINFVSSSEIIWFLWPLLGWGMAVAIHADFVFVFPAQFAVTEKMIEREMSKFQTHH